MIQGPERNGRSSKTHSGGSRPSSEDSSVGVGLLMFTPYDSDAGQPRQQLNAWSTCEQHIPRFCTHCARSCKQYALEY